MERVQTDFSKIAAADRSGQMRGHTAAPHTRDFADMVDSAARDASASAPRPNSPSATHSRHAERTSPRQSHTVGPAAHSGSRPSDAGKAGRQTDNASSPHAAARAAGTHGTSCVHERSSAHKGAENRDARDRRTEPGNDEDTTADTAVTTPSAVAAAVTQPNASAPDQSSDDTDTADDSTATEPGQAAKSGTFMTAASIGAAQLTAAAASSDESPGTKPDADHSDEAPGKARIAGQIGKAGEIHAEGEAGIAVQADSEQSGDEAAADGPQSEPAQQGQADGSAPENSSSSPETAHKAVHPHGDAGSADAQDKREGAASMRSDEVAIGAVQPLSADPTLASATATAAAGAQAGVTAIGSAAAAAGAAAPADPSSRTVAGGPAIPVANLGVAIATQAKDGHRSFDIRLDPPELGHIHVRLAFDRDGTVTSHLVVDRADTLDLLRRDAAQLQRALQDAGLKADSQNMQFSLRDQNAGQQDGHDRPHQYGQATDLEGGSRLDEIPLSYARLSIRTGGLDIRI